MVLGGSSPVTCYPFDSDAAVAYGRLAAAIRRAGREPRARVADLMIAATAAASDQPLYTSNADDLVGLEGHVEIIVI
jgi:predicted nucleic acid-binding protein